MDNRTQNGQKSFTMNPFQACQNFFHMLLKYASESNEVLTE